MDLWDLSNMGWVLSNMGWLGFVKYGRRICHIWGARRVGIGSLGFVKYGGGICLFDVPVRDIYISRTGTSKRQIPRGFVTYGEKH